MPKIGIGLIAFVVVLQSSLAHAQVHPPGAVANEARHAFWLDLGLSSGTYDADAFISDAEVEATLLMFMFGGAFRVAEMVELGAAFPVTFCDASFNTVGDTFDQENAGFVGGNPFFRGSFLLETPRARIRAGMGIALPLAPARDDDPDDDGEDIFLDAGTTGAAFAHGVGHASADRFLLTAYDPLYAAHRTSLVFPIRADGDEGDVVWAGEVTFSFLFDADDDDPPGSPGDPDETENLLVIAGEGGFRINREMVVGGRLQMAWHTSSSDEQEAGEPEQDYNDVQFALEPYFRLYGEGWFGSARLLLNLDEPLGVVGGGEGIWGLFVGGGWRQE